MLYQWPLKGFWAPFSYGFNFLFGNLEWVRLGEAYEGITMWGPDDVHFGSPKQGQLANDYLLAAMSSVAY